MFCLICPFWASILVWSMMSTAENHCQWHNMDILFVADSTDHVGAQNHLLILKFFEALLNQASNDRSRLSAGLTQFTPEARFEIGMESVSSRTKEEILGVPYGPCQREECRGDATSLNSLISTAMTVDSGNRVDVPDVIIVVSTSLYQIPELSPGEVLIKPVSVTHTFLVTVGNALPSPTTPKRLQFAATTAHFAAIDFRSLSELVSPLCSSVAGFVVTPGGRPVDLTWWHYLKWDVSTCTHTNQGNTVFWTLPCETATETPKNFIPLTIFILVIVLTVLTALFLLLICLCAIFKYRSEVDELKREVAKERDSFTKLDEYYRAKLRDKSANEKDREKAMLELINDNNKVRDNYHKQAIQYEQELQTARAQAIEHRRSSPPPQPQIVPIYLPSNQPGYQPFLASNPGEIPYPSAAPQQMPQIPSGLQQHRGSSDNERENEFPLTARKQRHSNSDSEMDGGYGFDGENNSKNKNDRNQNERNGPKRPANVPPLPSSESDQSPDGLDDTANNSFNFERTLSQLPPDHPARSLPPVDVLLLIDASGSIGNVLFQNVKQFLIDFTFDIDISPGRSRLCVTLFAQEPQVFFGFDRFYSNEAVARAMSRMPYIGGPTYLATALSFAAGVLYQDQNMKTGRKKLKTMPTPRHDRLQVMIVVSDGASDDNFDKQATHLHEKMLVKIGAVVTRSFNRDRLLPITRFDGSVFTLDQQQALSIWLWRQQRMWTENFADYIEREKSFTNLVESTRAAREPPEPIEAQTEPLTKAPSPRKKRTKKTVPKLESTR